MNINGIMIVIGLLFSAIYSIILGTYIWVRSNGGKVVNWFLVAEFLVALWTVVHFFELLAPTLSFRWFLVCIAYLPGCFLGPVFYMFIKAYNGRGDVSINRLCLIFLLPTLLYLSILTNPIHKLFYREFYVSKEVYGPLCYMLFATIAVYITLSVIEFWRKSTLASIYKKQQMVCFSMAAVVPISVHFFAVIRVLNVGFNISLVAVVFSLTFITIAVIKYQFLDILPVTLAEIVDKIDDGFLVVNMTRDIEDYNQLFFERLFDMTSCKTFDQFLGIFAEVIHNKAALNNLNYSLNVKRENYVSGEIAVLKDGVDYALQYTTKAINDNHGVKIGTIITFHDITELQKLYREHEDKKNELIIAKSKLEEHIATVQMLSIETEHNKLMLEVHDMLGHSMTELLALLEKCDIVLNKEEFDEKVALAVIEDTLFKARKSLAEIRKSVSNFKNMEARE